MRAMAVTEYGAPLEKIKVPEPKLSADHALIEVLTCGVCFSDVKTARGQMPFSEELKLPHLPGHEICGQVLDTDPPGALAKGDPAYAWRGLLSVVRQEDLTAFTVREANAASRRRSWA